MINSVNGVNSVGNTSTDVTFGQSQNTQVTDSMVQNGSNNIENAQSESKIVQPADTVELIFGAKKTDAKKTEEPKKNLSKEEVSEITEQLNELVEKMNVDIKFKYCEKLDRLTTQIIEKKTNKVLREFPPKEMINVLTKIHDWIGIILDKKA